MKGRPALHRYVDKAPRWAVAASKIVDQRYDGDASAIWAGRPSVDELQSRLDNEFPGIGQKKAAMAVKILRYIFGAPIGQMEGSDIPVDVHVRRVFLRAGLAERDDHDHIIVVARELHPSQPVELDSAWQVGINWRRPTAPDCPNCPLTSVCPKDIDVARGV